MPLLICMATGQGAEALKIDTPTLTSIKLEELFNSSRVAQHTVLGKSAGEESEPRPDRKPEPLAFCSP